MFISWHYILDQNSRTRFTLGAVGSCGLCVPHKARHQHELQLDSETIIICSVLNSRAAHTLVHEPSLQPALHLFTFNCWLCLGFWDRVMLCCLCCHWPGPHCSPGCPRTHSSGSALANLPSTGITGMLSHTTLKQKNKNMQIIWPCWKSASKHRTCSPTFSVDFLRQGSQWRPPSYPHLQVLRFQALAPHRALLFCPIHFYISWMYVCNERILYSWLFLIYYLDWVNYMKELRSLELRKEENLHPWFCKGLCQNSICL